MVPHNKAKSETQTPHLQNAHRCRLSDVPQDLRNQAQVDADEYQLSKDGTGLFDHLFMAVPVKVDVEPDGHHQT